MKVCLYFISVFFSSCCIADVFHYRMPFRIQTYSPVTKSKIENFAIKDGAQKLLQINREKLLMLLNRSSNECYHFDDKNVRIFSNCLSLANSGSVGSTFYQPFKFVASDHVTKLENKNFNE